LVQQWRGFGSTARQLSVAIAVGTLEALSQHRIILSVNAKREAREEDREKMKW
jgi:heme exporter protein D